MKKYNKDQLMDLKMIIENKGDCEDVPCYPQDCPIYDWCGSVKNVSNNLRLRHCKSVMKAIPPTEIFEALL